MQDLHRGLQSSAKPCTHKSLYFKHGLFCSLHREKSGAARIGGGERSEPVSRMVSAIYAAERHSRNADYILIARKGNPSPLNPLNPLNLLNLLNPHALRACPSPPERSEYNLWHRGPSGPMDAIRPSAP